MEIQQLQLLCSIFVADFDVKPWRPRQPRREGREEKYQRFRRCASRGVREYSPIRGTAAKVRVPEGGSR
jgi:hypothetical protein